MLLYYSHKIMKCPKSPYKYKKKDRKIRKQTTHK